VGGGCESALAVVEDVCTGWEGGGGGGGLATLLAVISTVRGSKVETEVAEGGSGEKLLICATVEVGGKRLSLSLVVEGWGGDVEVVGVLSSTVSVSVATWGDEGVKPVDEVGVGRGAMGRLIGDVVR
jgi:hypothetical protein